MKIKLLKGDITKQTVDAIVNAANTSLLGGGGVDGAIHKAGGKQILEECIAIRNKQGGCDTGEAVYTSGGDLPCKYVIHTVGPVWNGDKEQKKTLLANCYKNSLAIAEKLEMRSIAFPNISTGIYHFPKDKAAAIAIQTVRDYNNSIIEEVIFVCFDEENYAIYDELLNDKLK
jgi:O-acetyl-ADP-ribose deacetylase